MAKAGAIRAGRAFVELFADDSKLRAELTKASQRLKAWGATATSTGAALTGVGAAVAAPLGLATKTFASYEQAIAGLRAAANPTADQLQAIEQRIAAISKKAGESSTEIAGAFTELLKAGMSVDQVLGGAGEAAIKFAKVGGIDMTQAAVVMTDAMNVFSKQGLTATQAVDALSKAADASSIGIHQIAEAFAMSSAVYGSAGMSIDDLTAAIGILGSSGVKGSDAGTSLKTFLLRLQTGAESAGEMMEQLGINVRQADGNMKPLRGIVEELQAKLGGLNAEARDQALLKLFGTDAIRAGQILLSNGTKGWDEFQEKLKGSLPVTQKFGILIGTTEGAMNALKAAIERAMIEVGKAIAGPLGSAIKILGNIINAIGQFAAENQGLVMAVAGVTVAVVAAGAALTGVGLALSLAGTALLAFKGLILAILSPIGLAVAAIVGIGTAILTTTDLGASALAWLADKFSGLADDVSIAFKGIMSALEAGDFKLAGEILWASLNVVWTRGKNGLLSVWGSLKTGIMTTWNDLWAGMLALAEIGWNGIRSGVMSVARFMTRTWAQVSTGLKSTWNEIAGEATGAWAVILGQVGAIDQDEVTRRVEAGHREYWEKKKRIEAEGQRALNEIESQYNSDREAERARHEKRMAEIAGANKNDNDELERKRKKEVADAEAELERLKQERDRIVAGPDLPPLVAKRPVFGGGMNRPKIDPKDVKKPVDQAILGASRGTFSAAGAALLGGRSNDAKAIAKHTKESAKSLKNLERQRSANGFLFT